MSKPIAIDAMGGDHAPDVPTRAAVDLAREGTEVWLVGRETELRRVLRSHYGPLPDSLHVCHAPQVILMDESPSLAARRKSASSMAIALRLVRDGVAGSMVSAGNSGAMMAIALLEGGRIAGVQRPALAAIAPTQKAPVVILDVGANVDPTPTQMAQFAVMGLAYAKSALGRARPRLGLLTNGREVVKGTELTRATHAILQGLELDYGGYCEGGDVFRGDFDVVIVDGYTGNVALKMVEGFTTALGEILESEIGRSLRSLVGTWLMQGALRGVRHRLDPEARGGAPLLGLQHNCVVAHGAATVRALKNAARSAQALTGSGLIPTLEQECAAFPALFSVG